MEEISSTTQLSKGQISRLRVNVKVKCHDYVRHVGHLAHFPHLDHIHITAHAQCYNMYLR